MPPCLCVFPALHPITHSATRINFLKYMPLFCQKSLTGSSALQTVGSLHWHVKGAPWTPPHLVWPHLTPLPRLPLCLFSCSSRNAPSSHSIASSLPPTRAPGPLLILPHTCESPVLEPHCLCPQQSCLPRRGLPPTEHRPLFPLPRCMAAAFLFSCVPIRL